MQVRAILPLLAIAALAATPAAADAVYAKAKLAAPLPTPRTETIGGVDWKCEGAECVGTVRAKPASWSSMYACKKVSGAFGALASYESRGQAMSTGNLGVCNKDVTGAGVTTAAQ